MTRALPKRRVVRKPIVKRPSLRINVALPVEPLLDVSQKKCRDCSYTGSDLHVLYLPKEKILLCRSCLVRIERIQNRIIPGVQTIGGMMLAREAEMRGDHGLPKARFDWEHVLEHRG